MSQENELLKLQVKILSEALEYYKNLDIQVIKKNDNSLETSTGKTFTTTEELEELKSLVSNNFESVGKRPGYKKPNLFTLPAKKVLNKVKLLDNMKRELSYRNQLILTDIDQTYSNELIISNIEHNLVIDGSMIKNSDEMYKLICLKMNMEPSSNLSNINPSQKLIVIVENYNKMMEGMNKDDIHCWVCDLRNTMENEQPLLFVLLNANKKDDTFLKNGELVSRLIPFNN